MNKQPLSLFFTILVGAALFLSACNPITTATTLTTPAEAAETAPTEVAVEAMDENAATATVAVRSLRVRNAPGENAEVIAGISEGEQYRVLAISSDGLWVELAIDSAPEGSGWVSANFVTVEGPITDAATVEVPTPVVAEAAPVTDTASVTLTAEITTEVAADATTTITPTVIATPAPGFALIVTDGTRLRVRAEALTDAAIVGYVYNGESYQVLEVSADGQWVRIAGSTESVSDNPTGGWVAAQFVVIGQ